MYKKTIPTPLRINGFFLTFFLIPLLFAYGIYEASAKPIVTQCQNAFIGVEYKPQLEKKCRTLWTLWTKQILNNK